MKRILYIILASAAMISTGCNDKVIMSREGEGSVSFELSCDSGYIQVKAGENVSADDLMITVTRVEDGWTRSYGRFGDMPETIELGSGRYIVEAVSAESFPAAFDQPVCGGESEFSVSAGQMTSVKITCTLRNMKVTLNPTENFLKEFSEFTVTVSNGEGTLIWNTTDVREGGKAGYFSVAPLHVHVDGFRAVDNMKTSCDADIVEVSPRDHHIISLDARTTGAVEDISIEIDFSTNDRNHDIDIPGFEEIPVEGPEQPVEPVEPDNVPSLSWPANENLDVMDIADGMDVTLTISAPEKIRSFVIRLDSDTDAFMRLVSMMTSNVIGDDEDVPEYVVIDLINDEVAVESMASVGIATGENLLGRESVLFSLSTLVPMIPTAGQAGPDTYHRFILEAGDEAGNLKSWELVFHVPAE